jgi:phosphoribosylglycinamide formyltransferase-1
VTAELDGGPVIAQVEIPLADGETPATLAARLLPLEHRLLVACVGLIAANRVALEGDAIVFDGRPLAAPLKLRDDGFDASA